MARYFNIGGPCNPADHYMLAAAERLPEVIFPVDREQYFVIHAPRQCGKTTMFLGHTNEINAKGEKLALYALEVKRLAYYCKSHENAHRQLARHMDRLGVSEGWLVVFDPDYEKSWDEKISRKTIECEGKSIHLVCC